MYYNFGFLFKAHRITLVNICIFSFFLDNDSNYTIPNELEEANFLPCLMVEPNIKPLEFIQD